MNQTYEYEQEETEEGITLKKVAYFFKKAWLRMLIYVAVVMLLTTAIALPIKVFYKSEPVAQTSIEYIYDGIENGVAPDGSPLNTDNVISMTVLSNAVTASNLGGIISDITTLRNSMRVQGVPSDDYSKLIKDAAAGDASAIEKLRTYKMYATRFDIIISDPENLGLSDDQATLLLNNIVDSYYKDFQKRYTVIDMFSSELYKLSGNAELEFTNAYDIYTASLDAVKSYLDDRNKTAGSFVFTKNGASFSSLSNEINVLRNNLDLFNAYVVSNNIWRDKESAKSALAIIKADVENKLSSLTTYATALTQQIANFKPDSTTIGQGETQSIVVKYPEYYYELQVRLDDANRKKSEYEIQIANIQSRIAKLESASTVDPTLKVSASTKLAALEEQITACIKKINTTITGYYETKFVSSSVRQVALPIVMRKSLTFSLLMVYALAVIVSALAACMVTGIKISKAKSLEVANVGKNEDATTAQVSENGAAKK